MKIFVDHSKSLKKVFVCPPSNFKQIVPINLAEQIHFENGINKQKLENEHKEFCKILKEQNIEVEVAKLIENCPEQTFVRDLGFVLDDVVFIGKSNVKIREQEHKALEEFLSGYSNVYKLKNYLEGGDVVCYENYVFVGISSRTTIEAVKELKSVLPQKYKVVEFHLKPEILHLDTIFNYVGKIAVVFEKGFKDRVFLLKQIFDKVLYVESQQEFLPSNFLALNSNTIIASKLNTQINQLLKQEGITVLEGNFEEMLKLGGSYRCCSLEIIKD